MSINPSAIPVRAHKLSLSDEDMGDINKIAEKAFIATRQWIEMYEETSPEECFIEAYVDGDSITADDNGENRLNVKHCIVIRSMGEIING